jgi:hypothetical protein
MKGINLKIIREEDPMIIVKAQGDLAERMDPGFWNPEWLRLLDTLYGSAHGVQPLGHFIQSITYGQVGQRYYDPEGEVIYLQTRNITPTGVDVHERSARVRAGSWNDPLRSRLDSEDVLLVNSSRFAAGVRPIGKVLAILHDPGPMNISQDIDKIRLKGLDPAYAATFILGRYGNSQVTRICSGVGSVKINFDEVRSIVIPIVPQALQSQVRTEYLKVGQHHETAMEAKGAMLKAGEHGNEAAQQHYGAEYERSLGIAEGLLNDLIHQVEEVIEGKRTEIEPVERILKGANGHGA